MTARLEHANLTVRDIDAEIHFLLTACPEFMIRRDARDADGSRWVHIGTDQCYFALTQASAEDDRRREPYTATPGLNHLALEVDDADVLRERMAAAGYRDSTVTNQHPYRKRVYFHDPDGNDWEFIQYLSEDPALQHDYELPDKP